MNTGALYVREASAGPAVFELVTGDSFEDSLEFRTELSEFWPTDARVDSVIGWELEKAIRQWVLSTQSSKLLAVVNEVPEFSRTTWEDLPRSLDLEALSVVRLVASRGHSALISAPERSSEPSDRLSILVAGWTGRPTLALPGIEQEMISLSRLSSSSSPRLAAVRVLSEPSLEELRAALKDGPPDVLHLIVPGVEHDSGETRLLVEALSDGNFRWLRVADLVQALDLTSKPKLVTINACNGGGGLDGPSPAELLADAWDTLAVGWAGLVDDRTAFDFSLYLYNRLLEGQNLVEALRAFGSLRVGDVPGSTISRDLGFTRDQKRPAEWGPVPTLWSSNVDWFTQPLLSTPPDRSLDDRRPTGRRGPGRPEDRDVRHSSDLQVEIDMEPVRFLNPALLKNHQPPLTSLALNVNRPCRGVLVTITCDTGSRVSTVSQTLNVESGHNPLPHGRIFFPALYDLIDEGVGRRQINFTTSCRGDGLVLAEVTRSVLWMGVTEWIDREEMWQFVPAFVDPFSNGVMSVLDKAVEVLKTMDGPEADFDGYQSGTPPHRQVAALFNTLRDAPFSMNYIDVPPLPVYEPGDADGARAETWAGQRVRFADDVIAHRRGTCHDLALLLAACIEAVGIFPVIFLVRGHTFLAYWESNHAHSAFWREAGRTLARRHGDDAKMWTSTDLGEIWRLVSDGRLVPVEATYVKNRNAMFDSAKEEARRRLGFDGSEEPPKAAKDMFDVAIDVHASRRKVSPLVR